MDEKKHPADQIDKFRDLARELEADEDEAAFEEQVRKVAKKGASRKDKDTRRD